MNLLPIDAVLFLYNAVLISVWLPLARESGIARWMIAIHALGLCLPPLLIRARRLSRALAVLREIYPALWLLVFWRELGIHCALVGSAMDDAVLAAFDRVVFGVNLNAVWAPLMPAAWASELMQGIYFGYYASFLGLIVYLFSRRQLQVTRDTLLRISITYAAAYVVYAIAPTVGPMAMGSFPRFAGPGAGGVFRALNDWLQANGDAAGTAFPSTHVAGAITLAWLAWRHCPRWCAWLLTVLALAVGPATVYTQNHFALDALSGAILGMVLQGLVVPALQGERGAFRVNAPIFGLPRTETEAA